MIELKHISKSYKTRAGKLNILDDITLTIPQNSFVMLLGESGSGKSTLCNILGLLDKPSSGEYRLDGVDTHLLSSGALAKLRQEKISFVFQNFNLIPTMSVYDNIEMPLGYRGMQKAQRNKVVEQALEAVGVQNRAEHLTTELSGGEQQRIAIARALAVNPALLIADEPTGNLDKKTAKEIMALLKTTSENRIVFMVTHDEELLSYADMVLSLKHG